jgi:hypothetical protein
LDVPESAAARWRGSTSTASIPPQTGFGETDEEGSMSGDTKGPKAATDCTPCSPGIRNRYFRGKMLTVADYDLEQRYMIERRRLIGRAMLGWGVISGFRIAPADGEPIGPGGRFAIGPGFALDRHGRELVACDETVLRKREDVVWLRRTEGALLPCEAPDEPADRGDEPGPYLLSAHYAERQIDAVQLQRGCGDEICESNRLCETVIYSLAPLSECPSGLPACPAPRFDPEPADWQSWEAPGDPIPVHPAEVGNRGPHRTLAEWSMERGDAAPPCGKAALSRIDGGLAFDPEGGVPLACVTLGYHCGKPYIAGVADSRGPRRLARPNDSLFDLIRGCDLTRIKDVGWKEMLQPASQVDFAQFENMFLDGNSEERPIAPVHTEFWVLFSGPVWTASLSPAVITISLFHWDSGEAVRFLRRMPIVGIEIAGRVGTDPPGSTRAFRAIVHGGYWLEDIYSQASAFKEDEGTIVEIGIRGGMIVDVHGQLVAAGGGYLPSRPGWPGSDFISAFNVGAPVAPAAQSARRSPR